MPYNHSFTSTCFPGAKRCAVTMEVPARKCKWNGPVQRGRMWAHPNCRMKTLSAQVLSVQPLLATDLSFLS